MGWGNWLLPEDAGHQHSLAETVAELEALQHRLNKAAMGQASVTDELRRLTLESNALKLYVSTIFRVLLDKGLVKIEELETLISAIDREDGVEDGRRKGPVLTT
jgi:hypothetical protein